MSPTTWSNDKADHLLALNLRKLTFYVALASATVIALGVLREVVIGQIGTQTVLQDLRHIALDSELSVPAWYSSLLMVGCAILLLVTARLLHREGGSDVVRWTVLGMLFAAMAVDESVSFHEVLIEPLRGALGTSGVFYFAWVIPGSVIVALIGLYFLPFLKRLSRRTAALFLLAGGLYVGGALGFELVGGAMADRYGMRAAPYLVVAVTEESLEILGLTAFLFALVDHMRRHWPVWRVEVGAASPERRVSERTGRIPDGAPTGSRAA